MEQSTAKSVAWTFLSFGSGKIVSVATTVALAHLLDPAAFGLVALALLAISLLSVFNDVGLGGVLVFRQDLTERAKGTVLSVMIAMSSMLAVLLIAVAPLVGKIMRSPELPQVLVALSAMLFLSGPVWFYESLYQREMEFRGALICRLGQTIGYSGVAITLAALGAGVWSLVAGQVLSTLVFLAMLLALAPYRVRPAFERSTAVGLLKQGRGYVAQATLSFFQQNTDYMAVGRILGDSALGLYSMAYRLGEMTYWGIVNPVAKVTFPTFARMRARGEDVTPRYLAALRMVALVGAPVGILLSATAAPFTHFVLGPHWVAAIGPLTALGLWAALRSVESTAAWLLNSVGNPGQVARIGTALLVPLVPAIVLAAKLGGIVAVAWVVTGHMLVSTVAMVVAVAGRTDSPLSAQLRALRPLAIASALTWPAARAASEALSGAPNFAWFAGSVVAGLLVYGLSLALLAPELLRDALHRAGQALRRAPSEPVGVA